MEASDRPVLRSRAWPIALAVLGFLVLVLAGVGASPQAAAIAVTLVLVSCAAAVVVWALLSTRRRRRQYEEELTAWAAERAIQAERLRIARDLHDLASHGLGLVTVRAAAARTLTGPAGDAERIAALTDIEHTGRQATTELRRMLAVLRSPEDDTSLRPADTLADLPQIIEVARTSGVRVKLAIGEAGEGSSEVSEIGKVAEVGDASGGDQPTVEDVGEVSGGDQRTVGGVGEVSGGVQLTVCAIVREALANTARHAGPTSAEVAVRREADTILITVTDDGPGPDWVPHPGAGAGLAGLRERVGALDGTLEAGPRRGPGYQVIARLPDRR
ncbi:sensor histidine kinase [Kribbella sp. NPDC056951]|uniref:sensor histidine kinase n=1 Tax=Kribbella sp. NPDC056951 TaxID=3345978 RepID=UPI003629446C